MSVIEERRAPDNLRRWIAPELRDRCLAIGAPILLVLLWEGLARIGWIDQRFFPAPTSIVASFVEAGVSGELEDHTKISLFRIGAGFFAVAIPAIVLGLLMGIIPWLRAMLSHVIAAIYPIPKSALLPLFLLIFRLGEASKIMVIAAGVFFLVLINTIAGVVGVPQIYRDVSANFGARGVRFYRTVALPWALPVIFAGAKIGMNVAMVLIVIAEIAGAKSGIGYMIWNSWLTLDIERMYVGLMVISILGVTLNILLGKLERALVPWKL